VAFSRPTHFLGVLGAESDIIQMVMKDPPIIRSGLYARLEAAQLYDPDENVHEIYGNTNWKVPRKPPVDAWITKFGGLDVYDQTHRNPFPKPRSASRVSFSEFKKKRMGQQSSLEVDDRVKDDSDLYQEHRDAVYFGVKNNAPKKPPFGRARGQKRVKPVVAEEEKHAVVNDDDDNNRPQKVLKQTTLFSFVPK